MTLIAHLRDDAVLLGSSHEESAFFEGVRKRFLAVDGLAELHRRHGGGEVGEVGDRDEHRVDVVRLLVEHHAEVAVPRHVRKRLDRRKRRLRTHVGVAHRDKLADIARVLGEITVVDLRKPAEKLADIVPPLLPHADHGETHLAVRIIRLRRKTTRQDLHRAKRSHRLQEVSSVHISTANYIYT